MQLPNPLEEIDLWEIDQEEIDKEEIDREETDREVIDPETTDRIEKKELHEAKDSKRTHEERKRIPNKAWFLLKSILERATTFRKGIF